MEELAPNLAINIYRIIQEFIRNSQKHSGASRVGIDIRFKGKTLRSPFANNGQGFDPRSLPATKASVFQHDQPHQTFNGTYPLPVGGRQRGTTDAFPAAGIDPLGA